MTAADTKALVDRLRTAARIVGQGGYVHAELGINDAIAALSRPQPVTGEGCEPSNEAIGAAMEESSRDPYLTITAPLRMLRVAYRIDMPPREVTAYARGVEDAARVAAKFESTIINFYNRGPNDPPGNCRVALTGAHVAAAIRALLPKEPATEKEQPNA